MDKPPKERMIEPALQLEEKVMSRSWMYGILVVFIVLSLGYVAYA
jgi:hypothetical protein